MIDKIQRPSARILDLCFLIASALLICTLLVTAFIYVEVRQINPAWIFLSLISVVFFAWVWDEYRAQLRSPRFILFVCIWLILNMILFVTVLTSFGWVYLFLALLFEQVLFQMTAYWFL